MLVTGGHRLKLTPVFVTRAAPPADDRLGLVEGPEREADDRVRHQGRRLTPGPPPIPTSMLVTRGPPPEADDRLGLVEGHRLKLTPGSAWSRSGA